MIMKGFPAVTLHKETCVCVCVCVCERERDREKEIALSLSGKKAIYCLQKSKLETWHSKVKFLHFQCIDMFWKT